VKASKRAKQKKSVNDMAQTFKWKRKATGHYVLHGEYVVEEPEIMAEVKKESNVWRYCLWTWGTQNPEPLAYYHQTFKTAKEIKNAVAELVLSGEPPAK